MRKSRQQMLLGIVCENAPTLTTGQTQHAKPTANRTTPPNPQTIQVSALLEMAEAAVPASVSAALPRPPLSRHEILRVHLFVFQAAIFGRPFFDFIEPTTSLMPTSYSYPIYEIQLNRKSTVSCVDTARFNLSSVYRAITMRNKCDTFCLLMEPFVRSNLQSKKIPSFYVPVAY